MLRPLRPHLLAAATACALGACVTPFAHAADESANASLAQQRDRMPAEFREHLFGVPLNVRVELDGTHLGDADVLLGENNTLQLIAFGDDIDSPLSAAERARWGALLAEPTALGMQPGGELAALHYNLENSLVSLLSTQGNATTAAGRYIATPDGGSYGALLKNTLTWSGGQAQEGALRYGLDLQGSIGAWSTVGSYQYSSDKSSEPSNSHYISALYAQRELRDHFVRAGYFLPTFEGITRQPRAPGSQNTTVLGVMAGSSDVLLADTGTTSLYPVYVTASREGIVEIYRDGMIIGTQGVTPGMQELNTVRLPSGIYDVELRVVEDGHVTSRESATIHKPNGWRDTSRRWRYSVFAGQQQGLLDSSSEQNHGELAAGAVVNYLLHPRAVVGASLQKVGDSRSTAVSLDVQATDAINFYTNLYDSSDAGRGLDALGAFRYKNGSVTLSHARNWLEERQRWVPEDHQPARWETFSGWQDTTSVALNHRIGTRDNLSLRVAHTSGLNAGTSVDASWFRRQPLLGTDASWRVSVYDRPGSAFTHFQRQRGIDFTLSLALGSPDRRYSGSLGMRTGQQGQRDLYASATVNQQLHGAWLNSLYANANVDRNGIGLGAGAKFAQQYLQGDLQVTRGSYGGPFSGIVNLSSTVALGGGGVAALGSQQSADATTGIIVDVRSDYPDVQLRADDSRGGGVLLKPGRNFVPVTAYRAGHVQLDFKGHSTPAAAIQPATISYHLNKGGMMHATVDVLRTFTVIGQVVDADGNGARGVHVINHAGRSVSQDEGFFSVELSARAPVVELRYPDQASCTITLNEHWYKSEGDVLMVGALQCPPNVATH